MQAELAPAAVEEKITPRKLSAPLLALIATGLGHFAIGHWARGLAFIFVEELLLTTTVKLVESGHLHAFWPMVGVFALVHLAQIVDVMRLPRDRVLPRKLLVFAGYLVLAIVGGVESSYLKAHEIEAFKIPSGAMIPTLEVGDHIYVDKRPFEPKRGDVIVFHFPPNPQLDFVKRVIAVGGDRVEMRENVPVVNGVPLAHVGTSGSCEYLDLADEASGRWEPRPCLGFDETIEGRTFRVVQDRAGPARDFPEATVPPGHVYVMGDNRDNSHDSRFWGTVPPALVVGRAIGIWWSTGPDGVRWDRIGRPIR